MCFLFNDTATTEIYTLSLHDALPIFEDGPSSGTSSGTGGGSGVSGSGSGLGGSASGSGGGSPSSGMGTGSAGGLRSEEHTSEIQAPPFLVCPLLLLKKKNIIIVFTN